MAVLAQTGDNPNNRKKPGVFFILDPWEENELENCLEEVSCVEPQHVSSVVPVLFDLGLNPGQASVALAHLLVLCLN